MGVLGASNAVTSWLVGYIRESTWDVERIQKRLLTGEREDDAVRRGIARGIDAQVTTGQATISNLNDGISYLNIADAALEGVQSIMEEVKAIIEEAGATTDATTRANLNNQATVLISQANDLISSAEFGQISIFYGDSQSITLSASQGSSGSFKVVVGDGNSIQYGAINISSTGNPTTELARVDTYLAVIDGRRGVINAGRSRATAAVTYLGVMVGLYDEASVTMRSIDETEETANLERATAQQEIASNLLLDQLQRTESLMSQIYGSIRSWSA
jgi:flagellin-like hook-associated protein FlgL